MNVLIIEDEVMAQKSLTRVLKQNFPEMNIVEYIDSVKGAVEWLSKKGDTVDIVFMDVELADGVCFEIFKQVEVKANIIMTTAYDSYALKAFEAGSIDYLLKPIEADPLKRAVCITRRLPLNGSYVFTFIRFLCFDNSYGHSLYEKCIIHRSGTRRELPNSNTERS